jgi:RNA polymerase sigma-70 factor (ECF subfamily)
MLDIAYNHEPELLARASPQHHDKDLLLQVAEGDEHAFRRLFIIHHQQLGVHIHRVTNSIELAEEVVQDVFLKIWMARETLAQVEDFKAYLFVISKNHALNCLKKLAKEKVQAKKLEKSSFGLIMGDQQDNLYYNLLDEAIDHLPSQQQKVYLLSRHNRLKYNEIADQLKLSRETVKKYLQIATTSITDYVRSHLDVYSVVLLAIKTFFIFFQKR